MERSRNILSKIAASATFPCFLSDFVITKGRSQFAASNNALVPGECLCPDNGDTTNSSAGIRGKAPVMEASNLTSPREMSTRMSTPFYGCIHTRVDKEIVVDGKKKIIRCTEYDMTHSMKRSVEKYQRAVAKIAGKEPRVGVSQNPFPTRGYS